MKTCLDVKQLEGSRSIVFCDKCGCIHLMLPDLRLSQVGCTNCGQSLENGLLFWKCEVSPISDEDFLKAVGVAPL